MKRDDLAQKMCKQKENDSAVEIGYDNILAKGYGVLPKIAA